MKSRFIVVGSMLIVTIGIILYQEYVNKDELIQIQGVTMGVINYNIKYVSKEVKPLQADIDSILLAFNQSLSTYVKDSEISELNSTGRLFNPSELFEEVMTTSLVVWEQTGGTFDPTIGPIVNKWGFGPDKKINDVDSTEITELLKTVGFDKIRRTASGYEMSGKMYLDFSAVAKGYAVDLVARYLDQNAVYNYMVEIGGEVRTKGNGLHHVPWKIGIENPLVEIDEQLLFAVVEMNNLSMATSGNYRNYYEKDGRLIAHTINPKTGYSTNHNLLSATVFTDNCAEADAYATACMVIGLEESILLANRVNFGVFLIYTNKEGALTTFISKDIKDKIIMNKGAGS